MGEQAVVVDGGMVAQVFPGYPSQLSFLFWSRGRLSTQKMGQATLAFSSAHEPCAMIRNYAASVPFPTLFLAPYLLVLALYN
jgi:hypothetical protein